MSQIRTPEPRIPLEPEEYPLYKPPRRVGCSALTVVTLLAIGAFAFLAWRITPPIAKAITDFPKSLPIIGSNSTAQEEPTPGVGSFPTQTVLAAQTAAPTATLAPTAAPTSTPVIEYVKVANTGGLGVKLRKEPKSGAAYEVTAEEGAVFKIIGPNTPDAADPKLIWRHVELPNDGRSGYVMSKYLVPTKGPNP